MNRAERRRKEKEAQGKKKTYTLTVEQIEQIKKEALEEARHQAMVLLLGIPVLVLREQYGWGEKKRLPEFAEHVTDYYQEFAEGKWTVEEYAQMVFDYTGIGFFLEKDR